MIVSQSTSQVVYIIDSTRYTCYDNYENREIAKILLSEEYCTLETENLRLQLSVVDDQNSEFVKRINTQADLISDYEILISDYKEANTQTIQDYKELQDKVNKYKPYVISSIVFNLILITALIL